MSNNDPFRGDVWLVDWSPSRGSEQSGMRPALVVQTDAANQNPRYPNVIVAAISTGVRQSIDKQKARSHAGQGFQEVRF